VNLGLSLASAVLLVLIFPRFNFTWLAPFALGPLLVACARERSWRRRWLNGWAAGAVFWCGMCTWIQFVLDVHGGMGRWGGWGGFALFGLYKGLHMAVFAALAGWLMKRWWAIPAVAALWTGIERSHGPFGFAWLDLGNAGINMPVPMRLAPITGVYGLSFVFAMLGCGVASIALRRPRRDLAWLLPLPLLLILPAAPRPAAPTQRALVVQPNIDTEMTWTTDTLRETEEKLALLSRASGASMVLWPEVPAPFYPSDAAFREFIAQIAQRSQTHFLLGVVDYNSARQPLNSAIMVGPSGQVVDRYDKMNLVPFGEFIPPMFGWVNRITHEVGDFVPGNRVVIFPVDDHRVGAFICYESALPGFVRQFVRAGAEVLVNLSNDGYFGHSEAHEQHLAIVRMRAAENRRWIIRATNDGITAVIDPRGRVTERLEPFVQTAGMMRYGYASEQTPYTRYGDWFAWVCLAAGLALCVHEWRMTRTSPSLTI
jgi:apolipoprotein N-acyltransferase